MLILNAILFLLGTVISFGWALGVRRFVQSGSGVSRQTVNTTMLFVISVLVVAFTDLSSMNLLWMFPISWVCGFMSLIFPFSLLSVPGQFFGHLCCLGLNPTEVDLNTKRQRKAGEDIAAGMPWEENEDKSK